MKTAFKWIILIAVIFLLWPHRAAISEIGNEIIKKASDYISNIDLETPTAKVISNVKQEASQISEKFELKPPHIDIQQLESRIHELINVERRNNGLSELSYSERVATVARGHSIDMAKRNYFSHDSPEGKDHVWRFLKSGVRCEIQIGNTIYQGGENIQQNWLASSFYAGGVPASYNSLEDLAKQAVEGWMNSPGHRHNILTPYWRQEGIGVGISNNGKVYLTQNFC